MTIDDAIRDLQTRHPTAKVGATAKAGSVRYDRARNLSFHYCRCAAADPSWATDEYVAQSPKGAIYTVGYGRTTNTISCGEKGYHPSVQRRICES